MVSVFFRPVLNTIIEHMLEMATLAIVYLLTPWKEQFLEEGYGSHHYLTGGDVSIPIILADICIYGVYALTATTQVVDVQAKQSSRNLYYLQMGGVVLSKRE